MTSALELREVRKQFGRTEIIRGVNLDIAKGERHALIGPNGAGKSTTFNLISGRIAPTSGSVKLNGFDIGGLPPYKINRMGLSRSFQVTNIFHRLSVFENLRCAVLWALGYRYSFWHRLEQLRDARERAEAVLELIGLQGRHDTPAGLLTYAEQRALEIGITIAGGAEVILLDEPTAGMTHAETSRTAQILNALRGRQTILVVEHDMAFVRDIAEKITVLHLGKVLAEGSVEQIERDPRVRQAYLGSHGIAASC